MNGTSRRLLLPLTTLLCVTGCTYPDVTMLSMWPDVALHEAAYGETLAFERISSSQASGGEGAEFKVFTTWEDFETYLRELGPEYSLPTVEFDSSVETGIFVHAPIQPNQNNFVEITRIQELKGQLVVHSVLWVSEGYTSPVIGKPYDFVKVKVKGHEITFRPIITRGESLRRTR